MAFWPAYINKLAQPEVVKPGTPLFDEVMAEIEWVSDYVPHSFKLDGDEIVVEA